MTLTNVISFNPITTISVLFNALFKPIIDKITINIKNDINNIPSIPSYSLLFDISIPFISNTTNNIKIEEYISTDSDTFYKYYFTYKNH